MIKAATYLLSLCTLALLVPSLAFANDDKIIVNGKTLTADQIQHFQLSYGNPPTPGKYWYDTKTGMFGYMGRPFAGTIDPGHSFGILAEDSSNGRSGVYINGRQLPKAELEFLSNLLGKLAPGHYWMDANGKWGKDKNKYPKVAQGK